MWTVKRVIILTGSFVAILIGFSVYTLFLGVIDNLQALPTWMLRTGQEEQTLAGDPIGGGQCDDKLKMAFGAGSEELRRSIRYFFPEKGAALSAGVFEIEKSDGRVRMAPFSVAIFHKHKSPGGYPEISTIKSDVAFLTFDRPVSQFSELANRKLEKIELTGDAPRGVSIINNRRTAEKGDDVDILVTNGPLYYEERQNLIWTDGVVRLTDYNTRPPTIVAGRGLEMLLAKDNAGRKPSDQQAKNNDSGGIERLALRSDVKMHFWIDARSGFLTGSQQHKKPSSTRTVTGHDDQPLPPDKAQIYIQTAGMFVYDLIRETAWFASPPARQGGAASLYPEQVHVHRVQAVDGGKKNDQITCDRLDLKFRKKPGSPDNEKEIETAIATSRPENEVVLASDSENLAATGKYLDYRAGDPGAGAITMLKGETCRVVKDSHVMFCKELRLIAPNRAGEGQLLDATGPGKIDFFDPKLSTPRNPVYSNHVFWRDRLTAVKDKEGGQVFDLIKVVGDASFIDDPQKQRLRGEEISVWVRQVNESARKVQASSSGRQEIHRVIAQHHVRAESPEYIIRQTDLLTLTFAPEVLRDEQLPPALAADNKGPVISNLAPAASPMSPSPSPAPAAVEAPKADKPRAPIELEAIETTIHSTTLGTKKQLQELIAKGNVFVYQAGEKPGEKGLDIQGQLLTLRQLDPQSYLLVVSDSKKKARLESGDVILWGSRVMINQADNKAYVDGIGAMEMPSRTNLDGTAATRQDTRITVHWNKNMTFDGKHANFHGGVLAHQNDGPSKLLCEDMTAELDRAVSFRAGNKRDAKEPNAKIDRILCQQKVYIDDVKLDPKKQLERRSILEGQWATMDNLETKMFMGGPGRVRTLGKSSSELGPAPTTNAAPPSAKNEWKLTRIEFNTQMASWAEGKTKTGRFFGNVEVQYFPTIDVQATMNPSDPPKDALYLRCDFLHVETRQNADKTSQYMMAKNNVTFRTDQYVGSADTVEYDEKTDTIIFEAVNGNTVRISQVVAGEEKAMNFNSAKVYYNRKTGKMTSDGVRSLSN